MTRPSESRNRGPRKPLPPQASHAGRAAPPPAPRRETTANHTTANCSAAWRRWAVLGGAAIAALSVVAIVVLHFAGSREDAVQPPAQGPKPKQPDVAVPTLVLDWPVDERGWAKLVIDGQERPVPRTGEVRCPLPPRAAAYCIVLSRAGYEAQEFSVQSTADHPLAPYDVKWKPAADAEADSSAPPAAGPANPACDDWLQDFEKARQVAAAERKNILLLFAVSDGGARRSDCSTRSALSRSSTSRPAGISSSSGWIFPAARKPGPRCRTGRATRA